MSTKKSITKNYLYNMVYQILVLILPLITTPYVSRALGPDGVGMYGLTYSVTQYYVLFGCIGLNLYGQREIAYHQNNVDKRSVIFAELLLIRTITMSLSMLLFIFTVCNNPKYGALYRIETLELVAALIDITWFFQGMEEFKKIVVRNSTIKILGVVLIFLFVKDADDTVVYALILGMTVLAGNLSVWFFIPRYVHRVEIRRLNLTHHIVPVLLLFVPQIATSVYNILDKSMIGIITGIDAEVAYYEQAQKICKMALSIPVAVGTVMLPRIASMYSEGDTESIHSYIRKSMRFVCLISFPLCFGIVGIAKDFVPWFFGPGFDKVVENIIIISPIIVIVSISNVLGVQYLLPTNRHNDYTKSVVAGTIVNFCCNLLLIPRLLSLGAAIGSIIAEISVVAVQMFIVRKELPLQGLVHDLYKYFLGAMLMFACVCSYAALLGSATPVHTAIEILIGMATYGAFLICIKDDFLLEYLQKTREKSGGRGL